MLHLTELRCDLHTQYYDVEKYADAWTRRYRNKGTQSGTEMLQYRSEKTDARITIPAASASMPTPMQPWVNEHGGAGKL